MASVDSFVFYTSWYEAIRELDEQEQLKALVAIMDYQAYHKEPEVAGATKAIFMMAKPLADTAYQNRMAKVNNGKKGGRPTKVAQSEETEDKANGNLKKPNNNLTKPNENLYVYVNGNVNGNVKKENTKERSGFVKPTLEDVRSYCQERNRGVDPDKWFNYYSANGWKVGKNPMKDWKACVRTWEKNTDTPTERRYETTPW